MSQRFRIAISVDIDRFDDKQLKRECCRLFPTPEALRVKCAEAREAGLDVFPPCDNVDEKGHCKGHEE